MSSDMVAEMSPYFLGPMPCDDFFKAFLPMPKSSDPGDAGAPQKFSQGFFSSLEVSGVNIYTQFVKLIQPLIPDFNICNTSNSRDKTLMPSNFPLDISPDFSVMKKDCNKGTNSSKVEFIVEYKSSPDEDPFVRDSREPPPRGTSWAAAGHNPLMSKTTAGRKTGDQITTYAASQLSAQYRTHIFSILIVKDRARFIRWDRSGAIVTEPVLYNSSHWLHEFFIRYNIVKEDVRGWDDTVRSASPHEEQRARQLSALHHGDLLVVSVPGDNKKHEYVIKAPVAEPYAPPGRSTRVSFALDLQVEGYNRLSLVLLKDSWRVASPGMSKEGDIYKKLEKGNVPNVPRCLASGDIGSEGSCHSTQTQKFANQSWCTSINLKFITHRHHRLVLKDIGKPLDEFVSSFDMVKAIYAALQAHQAAFRNGILHRDISAANILITTNRRFNGGLLIDWDLCKETGGNATAHQITRTGTWQFMAADLVYDSTKPQSLCHDLESAFYVLLWQSILHLPNSWAPDYRSSVISTCFSPPVFGSTGGSAKRDFLISSETIPSLAINNNGLLTILIHELREIHAARYKKVKAMNAKLTHLDPLEILKELSSGNIGTSSNTSSDATLVTDKPERPDRDDKLVTCTETHSVILELFKRALDDKSKWPENDAAKCQSFEHSQSQIAKMKVGSKRSRQQAEDISGMPLSQKRLKSRYTTTKSLPRSINL